MQQQQASIITTSNMASKLPYRDNDVSSEEEEEEEEEVSPLLLGQVSEDEDDQSNTKKKKKRHEPPRPSVLNPRVSILATATNNNNKRKNRRRSSARFLDMRGASGRRRSSTGAGSTATSTSVISKKSLGDMYKRVIRMNAENRINASNSWNLKLIDNIDKFLLDDNHQNNTSADDSPQQHQQSSTSSTRAATATNTSLPSNGRVNFTKASCTLDASVKIYSYRVDDVHLTSYKVLANLHRTDNNKNNKKNKGGNDNDDGTGGSSKSNARANKPAGPTLESNLGNLNLSQLDSAFDIDPLFHKMSKTFDEGGAKGLLLVNLGTGAHGCNIVFDSSENLDQEEEEEDTQQQPKSPPAPPTSGGGMVDITSLTSKLDFSQVSLHDHTLVPQLAGLRAEYSQLEEDGYVEKENDAASSTTSRNNNNKKRATYAPEPEEEKEADRSIHQEAMERSQRTAHLSFGRDDNENSPIGLSQGQDDDEYAADDYGGGFDDEDDDDDAFVNFLATDTNASRFSSASFGSTSGGGQQPQLESQEASQQTSMLLDAIAAGQMLGQSDYEYFDASQVQDSNAWAGATHWKRASTATTAAATAKKKSRQSRVTTTKTPKKSAKKKKKAPTGDRVLVNLLQEQVDLTDVLRKPPARKKKGRRGGAATSAADPLQLTTVAKLTKTDNLLPPDAGIGMEALSSLFLRPDAALLKQQIQAQMQVLQHQSAVPVKAVGFDMDQVQTFGGDWDDGDDDDGGLGYDLGGDDDDDGNDGGDFVVQELDNVRKVQKVSVGYATVAKKVDVKRLKRDLWAELETHFDKKNRGDDNGGDDDDMHDDAADDDDDDIDGEGATPPPHSSSFQAAVQEMEMNKTQMDVTLPYYFICLLHLANEQGLRLESKGLDDFEIHLDQTIHNDNDSL